MAHRPKVAIVDDDESVRESLPDLLRSFNYEPIAFASAEEYLESGLMAAVDCLVLDVAMPGMSGPILQQALLRMGYRTPIIFITAHASEEREAHLLKNGSVSAWLLKPFSEGALITAIKAALNDN